MKSDGVYRFNLQFPVDTEERIRVGEVLERLGKRKSSLVVAALGEYLDRHPQWETPEVRVKIEQQSAMSREKLEELVRQLVEATFQTGIVSCGGGGGGSGYFPDAGKLGTFSKLG